MKKKPGRIPRGIVKYHTYSNTTTNYLTANSNANATRLGITNDEVAEWVGFNTTDELYYPAWSNKKIRNSDLTDSLHLNNKNCRDFNKTSKLLDRIAASPVAVLMDFEVFNIEHNNPAASGAATKRTTGIEDTVVVSVFYNGGGRIKFQCRPDQSTQKSHIPDGADHLEVRCKLVAPTGGVASAGPDDSQAEWNRLSSKAIVVMDFTPENVGQKAYLYFRWVDSKHPERNGAWTAVLVITIA